MVYTIYALNLMRLDKRLLIDQHLIFCRSGFQISRKSLQHEGTDKVKMFTETGRNQPSMEQVMKESTSFLVAEESRQASYTPSGHYKIAPLHRDNLDFEANTPQEATLSYVPSNKNGKLSFKY